MPETTRATRARKRSTNGATAEVVRTQRLEVVDSKGTVRAVIGGPDDVFGLTLRDAAGRDRVFLHFAGDGAGPELSFSNNLGRDTIVASFGVIDLNVENAIDPTAETMPRVHLDLHDNSGRARVSLDVAEDDEGGPHGSLRVGAYEGPAVDLSAAADGASVDVVNDVGMVRKALSVVVR